MDIVPRRGDIFYVDFSPTRGSEQGGLRPAVVVSNDTANRHSPVVTVCAITSREQKKPYPQNVSLLANDPLPRAGTILGNQILTVSRERLNSYCGRLKGEQIRELDQALRESLGL
jgi:mRNA interferase MazF